jgi:hypothetical protein
VWGFHNALLTHCMDLNLDGLKMMMMMIIIIIIITAIG